MNEEHETRQREKNTEGICFIGFLSCTTVNLAPLNGRTKGPTYYKSQI